MVDAKDEDDKAKRVWLSARKVIAATRKGQKAELLSLGEESIKKRSCNIMKWPEAAMGQERGLSRLETVLAPHLRCDGHHSKQVEAER